MDQDWDLVETLLKQEDWSPEQIAGRMGLERRLQFSHETIYRRIWNDKRQGGFLHMHLRQATKQRRKRHGTYDSRGRLAGKRPIQDRPNAADNGTEFHGYADIERFTDARFYFATHIIPGSAAPTRTPMDSSDSTSPNDRAWHHSLSTTATLSLASSTPDLGNDSDTEHLRSAKNSQLSRYKVDAKLPKVEEPA